MIKKRLTRRLDARYAKRETVRALEAEVERLRGSADDLREHLDAVLDVAGELTLLRQQVRDLSRLADP